LSWEWRTLTSTVAAPVGEDIEKVTYKKISPAHAKKTHGNFTLLSRNLFGEDSDLILYLRSGRNEFLF
jgi:hypothetical protein